MKFIKSILPLFALFFMAGGCFHNKETKLELSQMNDSLMALNSKLHSTEKIIEGYDVDKDRFAKIILWEDSINRLYRELYMLREENGKLLLRKEEYTQNRILFDNVYSKDDKNEIVKMGHFSLDETEKLEEVLLDNLWKTFHFQQYAILGGTIGAASYFPIGTKWYHLLIEDGHVLISFLYRYEKNVDGKINWTLLEEYQDW